MKPMIKQNKNKKKISAKTSITERQSRLPGQDSDTSSVKAEILKEQLSIDYLPTEYSPVFWRFINSSKFQNNTVIQSTK